MKYWQVILIKNMEWNWSHGYSVWPAIKALIFRKKYKAWLDREIVRTHRVNTQDTTSFAKNFEGLPKLTDTFEAPLRGSINYKI